MYYQVRLPTEDRNAVRFLWFGLNGEVLHYRMCCHVFGGIWCASSSTYALHHTLVDFPDVDKSVANRVLKDFYVDDCLKSLESVDDAIQVIDCTRELLHKGGFHLTKFAANDSELLLNVPLQERAKEVRDLSSDFKGRALGIAWDIQSDEFYFTVNIADFEVITRKSMLSI